MFSYNFVQALVTCKFNKFNDIQFHDVANSIWKGSSNRMDGWFSRASKSGTKCQRVTYPNPCKCLHSRDSFMIRISVCVCDVSLFQCSIHLLKKIPFFHLRSLPVPQAQAADPPQPHDQLRLLSPAESHMRLDVRDHQRSKSCIWFAFSRAWCILLSSLSSMRSYIALHHNFSVAWPSLCHQRAIQPDLVPNLKKVTSR